MTKLVIASEGMGIWCKDFLEHVVRFKFDDVVFENSQQSQLIIRSLFFNHEGVFPKQLPYITWSGESFECSERDYTPILSLWNPSDSSLKIPFLIVAFFEMQDKLSMKFNMTDLRLVKDNHRPYFLAYCASASYPHREKMFSLLRNHDISHGLGSCQNTGTKIHGTWHNVWKTYTNYRFVMALENLEKKWYVTEKLLNVLLSGAIPIYYGDVEWVKTIFNPKCIIFVQEFTSLEECAEYVKRVDMTPELYQQYINEPRFVKEPKWFVGENKEYQKMAEIIFHAVSC